MTNENILKMGLEIKDDSGYAKTVLGPDAVLRDLKEALDAEGYICDNGSEGFGGMVTLQAIPEEFKAILIAGEGYFVSGFVPGSPDVTASAVFSEGADEFKSFVNTSIVFCDGEEAVA